MILYAILESGEDISNFWAPFTNIYRICTTIEAAKNILAEMAEKSKGNYHLENDWGFYHDPELSSDGESLTLLLHETARLNGYTNWKLKYKIIQINNASELFKDTPF